MATGNVGREGGREPAWTRTTSRDRATWAPSARAAATAMCRTARCTRRLRRPAWGVIINPEPGLRIPNMFDAAVAGEFKTLYCQGEDVVQSDPNTHHVTAALEAMDCIVVQDIFLNRDRQIRTCLPARARPSWKRTAPSPTRAAYLRVPPGERRWAPMPTGRRPRCCQRACAGLRIPYTHPSRSGRDCPPPHLCRCELPLIDQLGSIQWPCNEHPPEGHGDHARG